MAILKRMTFGLKAPLILFLVFIPALCCADFYKYIDKKGSIVFTDDINQVPPDKRPGVKTLKEPKRTEGRQDSAPTNEIQESIPSEKKFNFKYSNKRKTNKKVLITEYNSFTCGGAIE